MSVFIHLLCNFFILVVSICHALLRNPVIIFPGFGNDCVDYINPLNKGEENGFIRNLESLGVSASVVPIKRYEWLKLAGGIIDPNFWSFNSTPEKLFGFYYQKAYEEIERVKEAYGEKPIIIGHSAGGWLARCIMNEDIKGLVTLGTPHRTTSSSDVTRGCLRYVNENYPGAFKKDAFYVSVASTAILSDKTANRKSIEYFAHESYKQIIGEENIDDFVKGTFGY